MAVDNEVFIVVVGYLLNYLIIYRLNRVIGSILFGGLSFLLISFSTDNLVVGGGYVLFIMSFISLIFAFVNPTFKNVDTKKRRKRRTVRPVRRRRW